MIHDAIMNHIHSALEADLVYGPPLDDNAIPGAIVIGEMQGEPLDPDEARISVTVHENDPDVIYNTTSTTGMTDSWNDEIAFVEIGGSATWYRRFTVKARALLVDTGEDIVTTRQIVSALRKRIEKTLLNLSFGEIEEDGEFVSKGVFSDQIKGEMVQAGGPPDAFDYYIKIRFQVETTTGVKP